MVSKKLHLFLFLISLLYIPVALSGLRCDLLRKLDDPKVKENPHFWKEYSELTGHNRLNDKSLSDLLEKHKANSSEITEPIKAPSTLRVTTSKRAQKELKNLTSKAMKKNFEEFMDIMNQSGLNEFYKNPSRWHAEKLNGFPKGNIYTVRLNQGYRVLFKYEKDELTILEVNAAHIHSL